MRTEDLKKKLQGIDNGRVRGRLKGNFGYMRSDEIARVQEIKKRTKTALDCLLDESHQRRSYHGKKRICYEPEHHPDIFEIQISNRMPKRNQDPEVFIVESTEMKVSRRREMSKRTSEVEMDFETSDEQDSEERGLEGRVDTLVV